MAARPGGAAGEEKECVRDPIVKGGERPLMEWWNIAFRLSQPSSSSEREADASTSAAPTSETVLLSGDPSSRELKPESFGRLEGPSCVGNSNNMTCFEGSENSEGNPHTEQQLSPQSSSEEKVGFVASAAASWKGLMNRVQKTVRGSADDIGWLQKLPGTRPVKDRTGRFVTLLGRVTNGVHTLPDSFVYLLVPGLFSNHGPLYFQDTKKHFSKLGLPCHIARIHSEASVEKNAEEVKKYVEELYWGTGKKIVILGHSKGGVDSAAALSLNWENLKEKVAGLVIIQSPYGGSPIASDLLREGQIWDSQSRSIMEMLIRTLIKGDITCLDDLTYDNRKKFLTSHPLPEEFPVVSFHSEASRAPAALTSLTQIAHADLPWASVKVAGGEGDGERASEEEKRETEEAAVRGKVPVIVPLPALMALCALQLELRYGTASDGMVARKDAEVPGSVVVRPSRKMDHAWMVYSPTWKDPKDVDAPQMCEALITLLMDSYPEIMKNMAVNRELGREEKLKGEGDREREEALSELLNASKGDPKAAEEHDRALMKEGR